MKRTLTLVAAALALLPAVAVGGNGAAQAAAPPPDTDTDAPWVFTTNFEDGYSSDLWRAGGDATEAQSLDQATGDDACRTAVAGGYGALRSYDPGVTRKAPVAGAEKPLPVATWAQARFPVSSDVPVDVKVTWSARNVKDCENCAAAAYVNGSPATAGDDFDVVGELGHGWQEFSQEARLDLVDGNGLFVALGWMGGNATIGLDCITVRVMPVQTGSDTRSTPTPQPMAGERAAPPEGDTSADSAPNNFFYNFETGLTPWGFGGEAAYGSLQQQYGENGCANLDGKTFASISNMAGPYAGSDPLDYDVIPVPRPRNPTLYMMAPFRASGGPITYVEMDWFSKSVEGCEDCTPLVYVGEDPNPPATGFKRLSGGFAAEWANNHFLIDLNVEPGARIYVGLGWQAPDTDPVLRLRNVGIDCLAVRIYQPHN